MSLQANFTFDRAGQGLFYYGQIYWGEKSFPFVYDCGTDINIKGASNNLSLIIKNNNFINNRIGLLAISHFDMDHVSHIPELLRKYKIDTVMLPYIKKELRAVFFAKNVSWFYDYGESEDIDLEKIQELAQLFGDPIGYFSERGNVRQIIGIQGDEEDFGNNLEPTEQFEPNNNEYNEDYPVLRYMEGGYKNSEDKHFNFSIYSGSPFFRVTTKGFSWLFRPLNIQEKLNPEFYKKVEQKLIPYNNDLRKLLSDDNAIKELAKLYDSYIGRWNRNSHSLLLRHGPEGCCNSMLEKCKYHKLVCSKYLCCCKQCHKYCSYNNSVTVLLGDLKINKKAKDVLNKHKFLGFKTGTVLIPHHGADSKDLLWLDKEIIKYKNYAVLVVSYGTANKYKNKSGIIHPRFIYDGTLADIENTVAFANEKKKYHYGIRQGCCMYDFFKN